LARQPKLLILDEPTNHLDEESMRKLLENLGQLRERPSILIITQNRSVAEGIARQYRLDGGVLTPVHPTGYAALEPEVCTIPEGESAW
jgi:ABC-type bacteriocin/lantibiotic exporter with double-glycine peptidase domain